MATGRKRKERRRLRKREAEAAKSQNPEENGAGQITRAEAQVVSRAITENWAGAQRFPTRTPRKELAKVVETRGGPQTQSLIESTALAAHELIESNDPFVRGIGMRAVVAMERLNQTDDRDAKGINQDFPLSPENAPIVPVQVNVQVNNSGQPQPTPEGIVIVQRADFYRNDAHAREYQREAEADLAEAAAASIAGLDVAGPVQDADLRQAVRQDVHGADGAAGGPRRNGNGSNGHGHNGYHSNGNGSNGNGHNPNGSAGGV